jgi:hypothetical protein
VNDLNCAVCEKAIFERDGYYFHVAMLQPPFHTAVPTGEPPKPVGTRVRDLEAQMLEVVRHLQEVRSEFHKEISRLEDAVRRMGGKIAVREEPKEEVGGT